MNVVLFCGPTLSAADAARWIDADCLPPAAQGDVYRAALRGPMAIGIVDGYFESVPSIWHKEILWAMSQGIHVFGSGSMGALRAAELEAFGMVGVGEIFEAYRDGVLEDDDEVAVMHGPRELGYCASEAMVNIRATLAAAGSSAILSAETAELLARWAKELYFGDRSYPRLLALAAERGLEPVSLARFRSWLPEGRINRKRTDAVAMLCRMKEFLDSDPAPKMVDFVFEDSINWHTFRRFASETTPEAADGPDAVVLEELRRDPRMLSARLDAALGWWLARDQARRNAMVPMAAELLDQSREFCRAHGIRDPSSVAEWLAANACDHDRLQWILESRALSAGALKLAGRSLNDCLLDYLRWCGDYSELLARNRRT